MKVLVLFNTHMVAGNDLSDYDTDASVIELQGPSPLAGAAPVAPPTPRFPMECLGPSRDRAAAWLLLLMATALAVALSVTILPYAGLGVIVFITNVIVGVCAWTVLVPAMIGMCRRGA